MARRNSRGKGRDELSGGGPGENAAAARWVDGSGQGGLDVAQSVSEMQENLQEAGGADAEKAQDSLQDQGGGIVPVKADKVTLTDRKKALRKGEALREVRQMIGAQGAEMAARRLIELINSPDDRVALQAATNVLERLYGRPKQEVDLSTDNAVRFVLEKPPWEQEAR